MTKEETKKELYKQNPVANMIFIRKGIVFYECTIGEQSLSFEVPVIDMGDADFHAHMPAKLLIRYLHT